MFRRCVMSQVRRLTTVSSREHNHNNLKAYYLNRTPLTTTTNYYRSHMTPFNQQQLLVFRSLSTATRTNHEDSKRSSEPPPMIFDEWINSINIYNGPQLMEFIRTVFTSRFASMFRKMMKKKYDDKKHVKRIKTIDDSILQYEFTGFRGASVTAEIRNTRQLVQLVVSGHTYNSNGSPVVIERHVTLPYNGYSEAKKRATFHPDVGCLVVEISDYKTGEDIKMEVQETKA